MPANFTVTITNMREKSDKTYKVNNYGQALGIVRCCLTRSGMAHIVGFKANREFVDDHYIVEGVHTIKIDRHHSISVMAWDCDEDYVEPARPVMTYNVYNITIEEPQKQSLFRKALDWVKGLF